jgi:hypothetical protein
VDIEGYPPTVQVAREAQVEDEPRNAKLLKGHGNQKIGGEGSEKSLPSKVSKTGARPTMKMQGTRFTVKMQGSGPHSKRKRPGPGKHCMIWSRAFFQKMCNWPAWIFSIVLNIGEITSDLGCTRNKKISSNLHHERC